MSGAYRRRPNYTQNPIGPTAGSFDPPKDNQPVRAALESILWDYMFDDMTGRWQEMVHVMETNPLWSGGKHNGDCTHQAHTCQRCLVEGHQKEVAKIAEQLTTALASRAAKQPDAIKELQGWKDSAMKVFADLDLQECGKVLGLPLGENIAKNILPALRNLTAIRAAEAVIARPAEAKQGEVGQELLRELEENFCTCGAGTDHRNQPTWEYCSLHELVDRLAALSLSPGAQSECEFHHKPKTFCGECATELAEPHKLAVAAFEHAVEIVHRRSIEALSKSLASIADQNTSTRTIQAFVAKELAECEMEIRALVTPATGRAAGRTD